ncbi:MAG: ATP-dependent sacrificial sulfur transferase LarE [Oscillospiraceae bacterium]|jgi:uncharacterized protein|nr:ATP-dependent sacrificial sulfur transferase LarE [Oscillospiraceae bacterium]
MEMTQTGSRKLQQFFRENPKVALAFSGGTDSSYLFYAAVHAGAQVYPYYIKTAFQPQFELEDAQKLADQLHTELSVLQLDLLSNPDVVSNPANRCYFCKKELFSALRAQANRDGCTLLMDGTNASDDVNDRPGMRALKELCVRSPLRECGLTKPEIRCLSREAGLFTWNKPAYACLATRFPAGRQITGDLLQQVESAEKELFRLGFTDFRVRLYDDAARLQFLPEQMPLAVEKRAEILKRLRPWFSVVLLDLAGR